MSQQYEDIRLKIEQLESVRTANLSYIKGVEQKIENLERSLRQPCIKIKIFL